MATAPQVGDLINKTELKCPICFGHLETAKILPCTHTFCEPCISLLLTAQIRVQCPICKDPLITKENEGNHRNVLFEQSSNEVVQSMASDRNIESKVRRSRDSLLASVHCPTCELKDGDQRSSNVYCNNCQQFMCDECREVHDDWQIVPHHVIPISGMISINKFGKVRRHCVKHYSLEERFACSDCEKFICAECSSLHHRGHNVFDAEDYEQNQRLGVDSLEEETKQKKVRINNHIDAINGKKREIETVLQTQLSKISEARDHAVQLITERSRVLEEQCRDFVGGVQKELERMEKNDSKRIDQLQNASALIRLRNSAGVDNWPSFTAHESLIANLEELLREPDPSMDSPEEVAKRANTLKFKSNASELTTTELVGTVEVDCSWTHKKTTSFPRKTKIKNVARCTSGKLLIGYQKHIVQYNIHTNKSIKLLNKVELADLDCLSDGRLVIRSNTNELSLYSKEKYFKMGTFFQALPADAGIDGGLAVDMEDHIYIGYKKGEIIQVFRPEGGKAIQEMMCDNFLSPEQIFATNSNLTIVAKSENKLKVVDIARGSVLHCRDSPAEAPDNDNAHPYPTVCRDRTILVAWVDHEQGRVFIERYSQDLTRMSSLVTFSELQSSRDRPWYYLTEISDDVIALCSRDKIYVFRENDGTSWILLP